MQRLHEQFPNLEHVLPETYYIYTLGEFDRNRQAIIPTLQLLDPARRYNSMAVVTVPNETGVWHHEGALRIWDASGVVEPLVIGRQDDLVHGLKLDKVSFLYRPATAELWLYDYDVERPRRSWSCARDWFKTSPDIILPQYSFR